MDLLRYLVANGLDRGIAFVLCAGAFLIFDRYTSKVRFDDELEKGNMAVAVVLAGLFIGLGMVLGGVR